MSEKSLSIYKARHILRFLEEEKERSNDIKAADIESPEVLASASCDQYLESIKSSDLEKLGIKALCRTEFIESLEQIAEFVKTEHDLREAKSCRPINDFRFQLLLIQNSAEKNTCIYAIADKTLAEYRKLNKKLLTTTSAYEAIETAQQEGCLQAISLADIESEIMQIVAKFQEIALSFLEKIADLS